MVFILVLKLNNMILIDALYKTEKNIMNLINIVLLSVLSVLSVFIGGNL